MKMVRLAILAGAALLAVPAQAALNLTGATVVGRLLYPDTSTTLVGPVNATVGAGLEFALGSFAPSVDFFDADATSFTFYAGQGQGYATGSFNGWRFDFTGYSGTLSDLAFNPASTFTPLGFYVSGNSIFLNVSGQSIGGGQFAQLVAAAGPGVPEPAAWALMLAGFCAVGFAARRGGRRALARSA